MIDTMDPIGRGKGWFEANCANWRELIDKNMLCRKDQRIGNEIV
jgi:hypothetical protein